MHAMAQEVGLGPVWVTNAITLAANDWDYTLPTSVQYNHVIGIRLNGQEWLMDRVTPLEFLALQDGPGTTIGEPRRYTLFEDTSQQVNVWVDPVPRVTGGLDVLRSQLPAALSSDSTNISFSDPLLRAFEKACAIDAIESMDEEERNRRKVMLTSVPRFTKDIQRALRLERIRIGNLRRSDKVPWQWV